jgi:hypothetical protein
LNGGRHSGKLPVIRKILETCISGCLLLETVFVMQAAEDRSGGDSIASRQSMAG